MELTQSLIQEKMIIWDQKIVNIEVLQILIELKIMNFKNINNLYYAMQELGRVLATLLRTRKKELALAQVIQAHLPKFWEKYGKKKQLQINNWK